MKSLLDFANSPRVGYPKQAGKNARERGFPSVSPREIALGHEWWGNLGFTRVKKEYPRYSPLSLGFYTLGTQATGGPHANL